MSSAQAASFVYVGNAESHDVSVLLLDRRSGDLAAIETTAIPGPTTPGATSPMPVSPDKRILFVGIRSEPYFPASSAIDRPSGRRPHPATGRLADGRPD